MSMWAEISSRYCPKYVPPPSIKVLVAGPPRGGTYYLSELLRRHGVPTGHESVFGYSCARDVPAYRHVYGVDPTIEVSGFAAPWALDCKKAGVKIVQYLRHPVACCTSVVNFFRQKFGREVMWGETCATYLKWHSQLEQLADHTLYLERLPAGVAEVFRLAGKEIEISPSLVEESPRGISTPGGPWQWADLPSELQEFARRHGYTE